MEAVQREKVPEPVRVEVDARQEILAGVQGGTADVAAGALAGKNKAGREKINKQPTITLTDLNLILNWFKAFNQARGSRRISVLNHMNWA